MEETTRAAPRGAAYKTIEMSPVAPNSRVYSLRLNRPKVLNALSREFFTELPSALSLLDQHPSVAAVILSGAGPHFCSGIDLLALRSISSTNSPDRGRVGEKLRRDIKAMQDAITALERCRKPVIAAVHGFCIGGGIDLITACDIRYCTQDTFFSVKEVDMGMTADLGTLQRLPEIVGFGNAMELSLTGRRFSGSEAKELGLVSKVFSSKEEMWAAVGAIAEEIAAKSPLAVTGTKAVLLRSRDLTLDQGLDYVATWNSGVLLSDDLTEAVTAHTQKRKPKFSKL